MPKLIRSVAAWIAEVNQKEESAKISNDADFSISVGDIEIVGSLVFGLPSEDRRLDKILDTIGHIFGEDILNSSSTSLLVVAQICLVYAVSSSCPERTNFVRGIMNLDGEHQTNLMELIQDNLQNLLTPEYVNSLPISKDVSSSCCESIVVPNNSEANTCCSCKDKDDQLKLFQREISNNLLREQSNDSKLKSELATSMNRLVDAELAVLEKDKQVLIASSELEAANQKVIDIEEQCNSLKEKFVELEKFKDEVDVLRPLAERAETNEKQVLRLREKLEELADIKRQLKAESTAHEETHSKLLAAELELDLTRKYKVQVDEYRTQLTESSITIQDLTLRGRMREEQLAELKYHISQLEAGNKSNFEQAQHLAGELQATSEHLRQVEEVGGIGLGMCELNPVLMQELNKLRAENEALQVKLDSTSVEALDKLEKRVADQDCMNASLQKKWLMTTDALQAANTKIVSLERELLLTTLQKAALNQEFMESTLMFNEDIIGLKQRTTNDITQLSFVFETFSSLERIGRKALVDWYSDDLIQTDGKLHQTEKELEEMTTEKEHWKTAHADTSNALEDSRLELKTKTQEAISGIKRMRENHEQELEEEREKCRCLMKDVDGEKQKVMRLQKERKVVDVEIARYRLQLQSGGSSTEIDTALREMKSMQQQLEEAEAEIKLLKSTLGRPAGQPVANAAARSSTSDEEIGVSTRQTRSSRIRVSATSNDLSSSHAYPGSTSGYGFIDHVAPEINDRRLDQIQKEKRELIAKNLEENKEKNELSQKLIESEREVALLRAKLTKVSLEKERIEKKYLKAAGSTLGTMDTENISNGVLY